MKESTEKLIQEVKFKIKNFKLYSLTFKKLTNDIDYMNSTVNKLLGLYTSTKSEANIGKNLLKHLKNTIKEIDGNSDQIIKIAKFIMDIFKQVNLLSLNTSIEVARAEESGRDFAVITEEISKLATRIDSNIKNIHSIITNNKNSTEKGYNNVLETSRLFNRVIIDLNTIQNVIEEIIQSKLRLEDENIAVKHIITQFENQILFMNAYLLKIS